ncbi:MAG TPA: hypothetical protein VGD64_06645 [Acidisarcina sp.]
MARTTRATSALDYNEITFEIEPGIKKQLPRLILLPKIGDVIHWVDVDGKTPVLVSFAAGASPCNITTPTADCVVQPSVGVLEYQCVDPKGNFICQDPGVSPRGGTFDFDKKKDKDRDGRKKDRDRDDRIHLATTSEAGESGLVAQSQADGDVHAVISCGNDMTVHVYQPSGSDSNSLATALPIKLGQHIQWQYATHFSPFTLSKGTCDPMNPTTIDESHRDCTIAATFKSDIYTVESDACTSGKSHKFYLTLAP